MLTAERTTDTFRWERAVQQGNATVEHSVHGTGITRESKGMIQAIEGQSQTWNKNKRVWLHWNWQKEHQIQKRPSRKDIGKETDDTSQQATESRIPFSETNEAKWRNRRLEKEKQHPNQRRKWEQIQRAWNGNMTMKNWKGGKPNLYPPFPWS